ncbi:MAG: hypothetical protein AB7S75_16750, partial [Desulfococcaceae bacterium]
FLHKNMLLEIVTIFYKWQVATRVKNNIIIYDRKIHNFKCNVTVAKASGFCLFDDPLRKISTQPKIFVYLKNRIFPKNPVFRKIYF